MGEQADEGGTISGLNRSPQMVSGGGDLFELAGDCGSVVEQDVGPEFRVTGSDAGGIPPAACGQAAGGCRCGSSEGCGNDMGCVAGGGQQPIMVSGRQFQHLGTEGRPECGDCLAVSRWRGGCWGEHSQPALKEVGRGCLRAALMAASQRMTANKTAPPIRLLVPGSDD